MKDFGEEYGMAVDGSPFSNSTEGSMWMDRNCHLCVHEAPVRNGDTENGCPLLGMALMNKTPRQWEGTGRDLVCLEFTDE